MEPTATTYLTLLPTPEAPGLARRRVRQVCGHVPEEQRRLVELLVSELVTNAVRHVPRPATEKDAPIGLLVLCADDFVRVDVHDSDPRPVAAAPESPGSAESGRGLILVSRLASEWGCDPSPAGGKVVWFELDLGTTSTQEGSPDLPEPASWSDPSTSKVDTSH
jgi:anti-sigma regulatory factor (Ser/Thr protein kinase)